MIIKSDLDEGADWCRRQELYNTDTRCLGFLLWFMTTLTVSVLVLSIFAPFSIFTTAAVAFVVAVVITGIIAAISWWRDRHVL